MNHPVTIENETLRMEVWPSVGGKIASLIDKTDGFELLYNFPAELPTGPLYDTSYAKGWYAGWDELFPAVGPGPYIGHPYDGIPIPDHGELWGLPTTSVPTRGGITTVWHGLRFGYRLTRKLFLDGASVRAEYTLINLSPFELRFVWAAHPLMSLESPVRINLSGPGGFRLSHDADHVEIQKPFDWPTTGEGDDLSQPAALPKRRGWKVFAHDPISGPATITYPSRGRSVSIRFSSETLQAYWGIWVNTGGWAAGQNFALQPTTGRFDQLERSTRDGSAGRVEPAGRAEWSMTLSVE